MALLSPEFSQGLEGAAAELCCLLWDEGGEPSWAACVADVSVPLLPAEIRTQLVEQFKCLEQQSESRLQLLQDLQEFFRRKAEIELEYSRSLEKLAERFSSKIRSSREHQFK